MKDGARWTAMNKTTPLTNPAAGTAAAESPLSVAHNLVHGDRGVDYGHPIFDMTRTADQWTGLFRDYLRPGVRFEAEDVAQAMIAVKQSRERNRPKSDNLNDICGYCETIHMIKEWRIFYGGVDPRDFYDSLPSVRVVSVPG